MLNEKSCPLWWFTGVSVCVLTGVIYRSHNLQPAVKCNMEGSRRRENHFPSYFHRNQGVKDHTHSYPLLPFSSLFSSQPFEEGIPSLGPLAFWLSDWWLHKETTSIIHWQNLSNWLCPHLPFPYNPSLMSVMMLSLFFLWIKCFSPLHLRLWTHVRPAHISQYPVGRREAGLKERRSLRERKFII